MEHIVIAAVLKPKEGLQGQLLSKLKKVQVASREEAGCIKYDLHQSEDQTFVLYEVWKDEETLEYHIQSAHYQEYRNNIADLVSNREVYKLKIME
ncbi:monooxygenase [Bacillus sp. VT 712]|uniref:Quinol monooxygenase n=1 Tax=Priestia flexa TaxID=86664 RepID=A0ABU4J1M4_9BACI|nr:MULTISPECIES: putative quinol monooxygenase [Bacillaceae]KZB90384.1 monooxygenase [Bacillus sp. VT 712]MDW8514877.1 putative quinol monooxygenase [Priestia flexa]MEC0665567.1 putative quinol monooxygenase [Priestia flexa]MED4590857.1 putative quinol monooxygenase [Priestia flexa]